MPSNYKPHYSIREAAVASQPKREPDKERATDKSITGQLARLAQSEKMTIFTITNSPLLSTTNTLDLSRLCTRIISRSICNDWLIDFPRRLLPPR